MFNLHALGDHCFLGDFGLLKETKITERQSLVIRMDSSNIFNHPTWTVGNLTVTNTNFGKITSTYYGRRLIQFSAQYRF